MARSPLSPRRVLRLASTWAGSPAATGGQAPRRRAGRLLRPPRRAAGLAARRPPADRPGHVLSVYDTVVLDRRVVAPAACARWLGGSTGWRCAAPISPCWTRPSRSTSPSTSSACPPEARRRPVGAGPGHFAPWSAAGDGLLRILFYGTFISLHGTGTIARAIRQVHSEDLIFTIVGRGQERAAFDRELAGVEGVAVHDWLPYDRMGELVAGHDVVLGIFGGTGKAKRVVPGKVYQAACAGRAIVTADTPVTRRLRPGEVVLVPPDNPDALAVALRELAKDRPRVASSAGGPAPRYQRDYAPAAIGRRLERLPAAPAEPRVGAAPRFLLRLDLVRRLLPRLPGPGRARGVGFGAGAILEELQRRGSPRWWGSTSRQRAARLAAERLAVPCRGPPRDPRIGHPGRPPPGQGAVRLHPGLRGPGARRGRPRASRPGLRPAQPRRPHAGVGPAHQDRFSAVDELVGHVRRYEREELWPGSRRPVSQVEVLWSYGFPLAKLLERVRRGAAAPAPGGPEGCACAPPRAATVVPARGLVKLLVRPVTMAPFLLAQRRFLGTDRGDGYLLARKPAAT